MPQQSILPTRQLAITDQAANERLLDDDRLHAIDIDAVKRTLQQTMLDLDAVFTTADPKATILHNGAHHGKGPESNHAQHRPQRHFPMRTC